MKSQSCGLGHAPPWSNTAVVRLCNATHSLPKQVRRKHQEAAALRPHASQFSMTDKMCKSCQMFFHACIIYLLYLFHDSAACCPFITSWVLFFLHLRVVKRRHRNFIVLTQAALGFYQTPLLTEYNRSL